MDKSSHDFSKLIGSVSLEKEIDPICMSIDDMITRLDELESLLANVKGVSNIIIDQYTSGVLTFLPKFMELKSRIDNLEKFVQVVDDNMNQMEKTIDLAEHELNVTDYSLKGLILKPLLTKTLPISTPNGEETASSTKSDASIEYQPIQLFNSKLYFDNKITKNN
uniref:Biogenesis of lysosome-related organelles complex 1 subunit 4 n=1 Tax=Musca domestica TaxID=7370 RepID=A0A1I8MJX2_MUSDO